MAKPIEEEAVELVSEEVTQEVNFLDMSDEEMEKYEESGAAPIAPVVDDPETDNEQAEDEADDEEESDQEYTSDVSTDEEKAEEKEDPELDKEEKESDAESTSGIDYKASYEQIFAPFKANNKEMKVDSVEDVITLMKMGANYNKKMSGLKPNLKLMKMLENNELLDEGKLSYLIDLHKQQPEAITKLIKESGIDPLDVDVTKDTEYKPNTYTVNDTQVELDTVLEDIRGTDSFEDTIDIVSNKWDESSRTVLIEHPGILRVINGHVADGTYSRIMDKVESERVLGRLSGLSDLEAYKQVGDSLQAQQNAKAPAKANEKFVSKSKKATPNPALTSRKKAASSTKSTAGSSTSKQEFNPLNMSDEDFEKQVNSGLL